MIANIAFKKEMPYCFSSCRKMYFTLQGWETLLPIGNHGLYQWLRNNALSGLNGW
jgi:hypothetical protein